MNSESAPGAPRIEAVLDERPEVRSFDELRQLVRSLAEELASFRRRALQAESRVRELEGIATDGNRAAPGRVAELERQNSALNERLEAASTSTRDLLSQVRFLRQQSGDDEEER